MSNALEIGNQLVALCREGKNLEAINSLYADNVVSVEAAEPQQGGQRTMTGIDAVRGKSEWWQNNHEIHSATVTGPYPHGDDRFATRFTYDITNKPMNMRMQMDEIAVYTVAGGKVVKEEFFYTMG